MGLKWIFSPEPPGDATEHWNNRFKYALEYQMYTHKASIPWSLTPKNTFLHLSCMDSNLFWLMSSGRKKIHSPLSPLSTPLLSALCWVCILRVQSAVFLSLGSVSMSLHLICIRFSTLSGSYLIPTQYAAEGNWVLRPGERERERKGEVFWRLFKFITVFCCGLDGARLAAQGHGGMRYSNWKGGESLANHTATAIQELFSSPHFNTTC